MAATLVADALPERRVRRQRPASRAYKEWGKGGTALDAGGTAGPDASSGGDADFSSGRGRRRVRQLFAELLSRSVARTDRASADGHRLTPADAQRLQGLYLAQLKADLRQRVHADADYAADRFPNMHAFMEEDA